VTLIETPALLVAAYLAPLILLGLLLARAGLAQWQKVLLLTVLPLIYIAHYHALDDLVGWPSHAPLPETFELLGEQIREPDKRDGTTGYIRLWIRGEGEERSRLYQMPYSKDLHQRLSIAMQRQARGIQQIGRQVNPASSAPQTAEKAEEISNIHFEDHKALRLPTKAAEDRP
jgi:hypothetical protein